MKTYDHVQFLKRIFEHLGIAEERVEQYFCAAAEVERFVSSVEDMTKKIEALPPLPRKTLTSDIV